MMAVGLGQTADRAVLAADSAAPRGAGYYVVLAMGLAATLAATIAIARIAGRALDRETRG